MRHFYCSLLLVFGIVSCFAQSRWSIGTETQLGLSGKSAKEVHHSSFGGTVYENAEWNTVVAVAGAGLWAQYQILPEVGIRTGVSYLNGGNNHKRQGYSEVLATGQKTLTFDQSYSFRTQQLVVPLELVLELGKGQVRPFFSVGAQWSKSRIGTIFDEETIYRTEDYVLAWTEENRDRMKVEDEAIQLIASLGLRLNDDMVIRIRRVWSQKEQSIEWYQNFDMDFYGSEFPIFICGTINSYRTRSFHQQLTSVQFSYRLF